MDARAGAIIRELRAEIERLRAENAALRARLDEAERVAARQAAPFRRREAKRVPPAEKKKPGRPKGHPGAHRQIPDHVDEQINVPLNGCPKCGGAVDGVTQREQFIEEIPVVQPRVTRLVTYHGHCPNCDEDVASSHPLKMSEAEGAAKVQLGPRAVALAIFLNKQLGLTLRSTCRALLRLTGLKVSPGGLVDAMRRAAEKHESSHQNLIMTLRGSPAVFADETSWYVGDPKWWLWVFTNAETTAYVVDRQRAARVPLEVLGPDFRGTLVSDCLAAYESLPYKKHKCIAHHLKAIAKARDRPDTPNPDYLHRWTLFFQMVIGLWRARPAMDESWFAEVRGNVESWRDRLLAEPVTQPGDVSARNRFAKRRDEILGCLYEPAAEPTNNRAERALRPAVIARKLSCGNKTEAGKRCFEVLTSLAATCAQRGHDFVSWMAESLPLMAEVAPVPPRMEFASSPTR